MGDSDIFELVRHGAARSPLSDPLDALAARRIPLMGGDLKLTAGSYRPDEDLVEAVNVALATGQPLLVTGEPGTGKTQLAYFLVQYFGINAKSNFFRLDVRSNTTHDDLTYQFDAVAYLHAANDPKRKSDQISKGEFVVEGVLWQAYEAKGPAVVLLDEIDKAPRDFPNDLLRVLDEHSFKCPERNLTVTAKHGPPPLIVVTSNNERRLPDAFLRRCIFHHIELTPQLIDEAVTAHIENQHFPELAPGLQQAAIGRFLELRERPLNKPPSLGELLMWLAVLAAKKTDEVAGIAECDLKDLPGRKSLLKDKDDLDSLG